ncbi:MAG: efflux RND transporter permease subunit [Burkholderiales bacterium]|jgi:HAE1 family hydrophobic/amphiphilic exporter-1|nr:efflux RND transporter permease subunit [Burkholderiales bacterium]
MWLTRVSVRNPVFATMMMAAFLVLGLFSYFRLPVEQFPEVNFPVVVVQTEYPGASPETVESDLTRKIEEVVNTVSGIKQISSRSYEGLSLVIAEFQLTVDPAVAAQDVREKVAIIRPTFRKEVKEPKISRFNPDDLPVVSIALRSETRSPRDLTTLADQVIRKRIENVRGVGQVTIVGGVKREVQILLRPADLEAMGIGVDQVVNAIRAENQELPAGSLTAREREQMVQVQARLERPVDFNRIIVARRGGQPVFLSQVATVVDGQEEEENLALVDGRRAVALDVVKAQDANTIDTVDGVKQAIAAVAKTLPPDVSIEVVRDTSEGIRNSVNNVKRTLVEGAALTVLIVFLFLNSWRSTIITGLTLPISLIGTFLVMYAFGFTVNMLTLMALSITVGLLIDDAIVVRENIVRHLGMGKGHRQAALDGTQEIGLAVLATTFTIVAVFLPVGFMGGIIGRFFHQFGITVAAAVLLSMFVSFTLDPMLSSIWYDPAAHGKHGTGPLARLTGAFERFQERLAERYTRLIRWALGHRKTVIAAAIGTFAGALALVPFIGSEFVPEADLGEIMVQAHTPVGSSLDFTRQKLQQAEAALREFPEVKYTYATINTGTALGKNYATIFAKLSPRKDRKLSQKQLQVPIRERLARIAGLNVTYVGVFNAVGSGKPLQVSVQGPDTKVLERLSGEVVAIMRGIGGVVDVDTSQKQAKPTIAVRLNRELASDLGVGVDRVGAALRPLIAGEAASTWRAPDDETYEVKVRLARSDRASTADLERIYVASQQANPDGSPKMVALRQVADFTPALGATQINRKDLTREVLVTANVSGRPAGDLGKAIKAELDRIELPPGYRFAMGGSTKDIQETLGHAATALVLAVVFIYLILASQFGSFLQPVAIMASLPLALIGVLVALMLTRSTLNIFSIIGFVMLMGLVTKNAILLVDFVNQAVKRGMPRAEAIVEAGRVRLRPILMTTFAMVFGMIPLALGLGEGGEQRAPMGIAVIGGVIASTLLTLVVVPVLYTYVDDLARAAMRSRRGGGAERAEAETGNPAAG